MWPGGQPISWGLEKHNAGLKPARPRGPFFILWNGETDRNSTCTENTPIGYRQVSCQHDAVYRKLGTKPSEGVTQNTSWWGRGSGPRPDTRVSGTTVLLTSGGTHCLPRGVPASYLRGHHCSWHNSSYREGSVSGLRDGMWVGTAMAPVPMGGCFCLRRGGKRGALFCFLH